MHQKSLPLCGRPRSPVRFDFVSRLGQAMASATAQAPYGELNKYEADNVDLSSRVSHRAFQGFQAKPDYGNCMIRGLFYACQPYNS
jgi:hypothetical protein